MSIYLYIYALYLDENARTLASCSFDKHGLISIIFDKRRHQRTLKKYRNVSIPLSLTFHFYICLYIAGTEMTRC